jgi:hypothetical protein
VGFLAVHYLQWAVSIGRIDITTAVMTLSRFRSAPRQGHLDRTKRVYGYLSKIRHVVIRIRTEEPDYSGLPEQEFEWAYSVYGNVQEVELTDAPGALGKYVTLTHYVDANLFHDLITGRSVTGILHLVNKTPIDWYSTKQATVETATYGSEFVAARTCVEQVMDLRITLRYLGVLIRTKSYMFGDNKTVVESSIRPHAKLHKRHMALSFYRVREAIAAKIVAFHHVDGVRILLTSLLASIGVTSKFGKCFALYYSGRTIRLTFSILKMSRIRISQDPGVWYLMAARLYGL